MYSKQCIATVKIICMIASLCCNEKGTGASLIYKKTIGAYVKGEPFCNLSVRDPLLCVVSCTEHHNCKLVNVLKTANDNQFTCELFNVSLGKKNISTMQLVSASIYSLSSDIVVPDCVTAKRAMTVNTDWKVLQRRFDGSVDFNRSWDDYKHGFGDLNGEFWLGLDSWHEFMKDRNVTLRFEMWRGSNSKYMDYHEAKVRERIKRYRLDFNGVSGNAGDAMTLCSKNQKFTTYDENNVKSAKANWASQYGGGWWFSNCSQGMLNGQFGRSLNGSGCHWVSFARYNENVITKTEIKIKFDTR